MIPNATVTACHTFRGVLDVRLLGPFRPPRPVTPGCRPPPLPLYLNGVFWYPSPPSLSVAAVRAFVAGGLSVPSLSAAARFISPVLFPEVDDGDEG